MLCPKVQLIFDKFARMTTAPVSFAFLDLKTGAECYKNGDEVLPAASTYKLFLLMALYYKAQSGLISLSEELTLADRDKSVGTGMLYNLTSGLTMTVEDLSKMMMAISDNTAADMLYHYLTPEYVQREIIDKLGLVNTKLRMSSKELLTSIYGRPVNLQETSEGYFLNSKLPNRYIDGNDGNCLTAKDMATALQEIYAGQLFNKEFREKIISVLLLCQTNERLPKLLPPKVKVAHKTGSIDRITNDGGLIFTEQGAYILVLLVNGNLAVEQEYQENRGRVQTDKMLAEISKEVYNAYCHGGERVE